MIKKALLIGINRYKIPGADLRGCVNDVESMGQVLREFYGFEDRDIRVLKDLDATKTAIQDEYGRLLEGAEPGDVLFAHYSGHGSNVPDKNGDEADHRDEILCPTDLDWYQPLLDDWLRDLFDHTPEGANLTLIMDCCHSGSITRAVIPPDSERPIQRFLPCPLDLLAAESGRGLRGARRGIRRDMKHGTEGDVRDVDMPELLITGCRDDQTSADAYIDGEFCGALTYALVNSIRAAKGRLTYKQLHTAAEGVLAGKYEQVPQLEGRAVEFDREFLSPMVHAAV